MIAAWPSLRCSGLRPHRIVSNAAPTSTASCRRFATVSFYDAPPNSNNLPWPSDMLAIREVPKLIATVECGSLRYVIILCYNCNFIFTAVDIVLTSILSLHFVIIFSAV